MRLSVLLLIFSLIFSARTVFSQFEIDSLKQKWSASGRESIEGIYSLSNSERTYSLALARDNDVYKLVYLEGDQKQWVNGDLKAMVVPTDKKIFEGRWNAGVPENPILEDIKIVFGDKKFILYWPDWSIDEFKMTYPDKAVSETDMSRVFKEEAFKRNYINIDIQVSDSGLVEIPLLVNDVLKIYVGLEKTKSEVVLSKDIAKTLIQTKTLGYTEWVEGNYYQFIDKNQPFSEPHAFIINSLKIGNEELKNVKAVISKDLNHSMLINIALLERIGKVNIDVEKELITITKK